MKANGGGVEGDVTLYSGAGPCTNCDGLVSVPGAAADGFVTVTVTSTASMTTSVQAGTRYRFYSDNCISLVGTIDGEFGAGTPGTATNTDTKTPQYVLDRVAPTLTHTAGDTVAQNAVLSFNLVAAGGSADQDLSYRVGGAFGPSQWSSPASDTYGSGANGIAANKLINGVAWNVGCAPVGEDWTSLAQLTRSDDLCSGDYADPTPIDSTTTNELFDVTPDGCVGETNTTVVTAPLGGGNYGVVECFNSRQLASKGKNTAWSDPAQVHVGTVFISGSTDYTCATPRTGVTITLGKEDSRFEWVTGKSTSAQVYIGQLADQDLLDYQSGTPLMQYSLGPKAVTVVGDQVILDMSDINVGVQYPGCDPGEIPGGADIYIRAHATFRGPSSTPDTHTFTSSLDWNEGGPLNGTWDVLENPAQGCTDGILNPI